MDRSGLERKPVDVGFSLDEPELLVETIGGGPGRTRRKVDTDSTKRGRTLNRRSAQPFSNAESPTLGRHHHILDPGALAGGDSEYHQGEGPDDGSLLISRDQQRSAWRINNESQRLLG